MIPNFTHYNRFIIFNFSSAIDVTHQTYISCQNWGYTNWFQGANLRLYRSNSYDPPNHYIFHL